MLRLMATRSARNVPSASSASSAVETLSRPCSSVTKPSRRSDVHFDRPPQPLRGPQHQHHLRVDAAAHAEAAADLAGDHAHVALGHLQDCSASSVRGCRAVPGCRCAACSARAPVVLADGGARLERRGGHARDDEVERASRGPRARRRGRPPRVSRPARRRRRCRAPRPRPPARPAAGRRPSRRRRRAAARSRRATSSAASAACLARLGDHQRDADRPRGGRAPRASAGRGVGKAAEPSRPLAAGVGGQVAEPVGGQIGPGEDREHAGRRERGRARRCRECARAHGASARRRPQACRGRLHVVRVAAEALDEPRVLDPAHRLSDGELLDGDRIAHDGPLTLRGVTTPECTAEPRGESGWRTSTQDLPRLQRGTEGFGGPISGPPMFYTAPAGTAGSRNLRPVGALASNGLQSPSSLPISRTAGSTSSPMSRMQVARVRVADEAVGGPEAHDRRPRLFQQLADARDDRLRRAGDDLAVRHLLLERGAARVRAAPDRVLDKSLAVGRREVAGRARPHRVRQAGELALHPHELPGVGHRLLLGLGDVAALQVAAILGTAGVAALVGHLVVAAPRSSWSPRSRC